jgi:hypothetical protein
MDAPHDDHDAAEHASTHRHYSGLLGDSRPSLIAVSGFGGLPRNFPGVHDPRDFDTVGNA